MGQRRPDAVGPLAATLQPEDAGAGVRVEVPKRRRRPIAEHGLEHRQQREVLPGVAAVAGVGGVV